MKHYHITVCVECKDETVADKLYWNIRNELNKKQEVESIESLHIYFPEEVEK